MNNLKVFSIKQISYSELVELKNIYNLEVTPFVHDDGLGIHKILYGNDFLGIIIFNLDKDLYGGGILIDYFEILANQRNKGFGEKFITTFINSIKSSLQPGTSIPIFITPIPESESFWISLGFTSNQVIQPMFKYNCIS